MFKGLGGLGDMGKMMKAAQEMQGKMAQMQEEMVNIMIQRMKTSLGRSKNWVISLIAYQFSGNPSQRVVFHQDVHTYPNMQLDRYYYTTAAPKILETVTPDLRLWQMFLIQLCFLH